MLILTIAAAHAALREVVDTRAVAPCTVPFPRHPAKSPWAASAGYRRTSCYVKPTGPRRLPVPVLAGVDDVSLATECFDDGEEFCQLRERARLLPEPVDLRNEGARDVRLRLGWTDFGPVQLRDFTTAYGFAMNVGRGPRLIRQSDPESYTLLLNVHGMTGVAQGDHEATLKPGDIGLYDSSRPLRGWRRTDDGPGRLIMLALPRHLLPVHPDQVARVTGVRIPGRDGTLAMLCATARNLTHDAAHFTPAESARLPGILADLAGLLVTHALDAHDHLGHEAQQRLLILRIKAYIDQHLTDTSLSPAEIAAAPHISVRTLHRLFQHHDLTVAGWIRQRRLDQCRRNLADTSRADQPINVITRRWRFADGAHLTKAFKAAYGITLSAWRELNREIRRHDGPYGNRGNVADAALGALPAGRYCHNDDGSSGNS
ncbi:helix-turn-helix domain-containing protein [Streptomyces sp. NBC_00079]|uniref:helix-turn-helix domain-containing protein n=1 Tax=Streptomyces sp. NBC_00079 TaxID=2975644 RepID=UPI00324BEC7C